MPHLKKYGFDTIFRGKNGTAATAATREKNKIDADLYNTMAERIVQPHYSTQTYTCDGYNTICNSSLLVLLLFYWQKL